MIGWALTIEQTISSFDSSKRSSQLWQDQAEAKKWRAAIYQGLQIGKSSRKDLLHKLGQPKSISPEADSDPNDSDRPIAYEYSVKSRIKGDLTVIIGEKSLKILRITLYPKHLSKQQGVKIFGNDYLISRYDFCEGVEDTTAPVYLSQEGKMLCLEYPKQGVSLSVDDDDNITEINYLSKSPGLLSKRDCPISLHN